MIGDLLISYCKEHFIGEQKLHEDSNEFVFEFMEADLDLFKKKGFLFHGSKGGLVLGNLHSQGGIQLLRPMGDGTYRHAGEMEGWEYLTGPLQWLKTREVFDRFNREEINDPTANVSFEIPEMCEVIDTSGVDVPILVLDGNFSQFIINRFATKKYIEQILQFDLLNTYANFHLDKISEEYIR